MPQTPDSADSAEQPTEKLELKMTSSDKKLIRVAAAMSGGTMSAFARKALRSAARDVIEAG